jgi:hypothetical protein
MASDRPLGHAAEGEFRRFACGTQTVMPSKMTRNSYRGYPFPPEIIQRAIS